MKKLLTIIFFSIYTLSVNGLNFIIIESTSFNGAHNMDTQWLGVVTGMGHTASIVPQTTLDNNAFFATTDVLIVSSGVIALSAARRNIIQQFEQSGKPVYIQSEYDCNYTSNQAFTQVVTNGGGTFNWVATVAGDLIPMNVLGTFATINAAVSPLGYYWYSCNGNAGCNVFPFLTYGGTNHGFYFCPPNPAFGVVITTTDQDWVRVGTSIPLMQNIITHLITPSLCGSNNAISVSLGNDTTLCSGSLTLNATTTGATYLWNTGSTAPTLNVSTTGVYFVAVNVGGCIARDTIQVTFSNSLTVNLGNDTTICQGNSITLNAGNPGATYLWNTGATTQTISVNTSGNYSVTVSLAGCSNSDNINVNVAPIPTINLGNDTSICQGSTLTLNAGNPGATFLWSTGATTQTISASTSGNYSVQVNIGSCIANDNLNLNVNPLPVVNLGNDTSICQGNFITLDASNTGATFLWNTGATTQTITASTSGNYSVQVSIGNCIANDNLNLNVNPLPVVNLGNDTSICQGNTITLDAGNPGATYLWNTGATTQTITASTSGNYSVVVTSNNCNATDNTNLTVNPLPLVNLGNDTSLCIGSTLNLNAGNPGATFLWNTTETTSNISVSSTDNYSVTVTQNGCSNSDNILVTFQPSLSINLGPDTSLCVGNTLTLNPGFAGANFIWNTGATSQTLNVTNNGQYIVEVTAAGCSGTDTININFNPLPVLNLGNDTTLCDGTSLTLNGTTAGASYLWSTGATTATIAVTITGIYNLTVSVNNCSATDQIQVTFLAPPVVNLGADTTLCIGNQLILNAGNPGLNFNWSTGNTTQQILVNNSGLYTVTVSNTVCSTSDAIQVNFSNPPVVNIGNDTTFCAGAIPIMNLNAGNPGATFLWSNGSNTQSIDILGSGIYSVQVSIGGCVVSDSISISTAAGISLPERASLCDGEAIVLNVGNHPNATFIWSNGETTPSITVTEAGVFTVIMTDGNCVETDQTIVNGSITGDLIFVPNAFTPNNDGRNDVFKVEGNDIIDYQIYIFNRWGQIVFESNNRFEAWDGTHRGVKCENGIYIWRILYSSNCNGNVIEPKTGSVSLVR